MKTCSNCHTQLPDDAVFCTNCGSRFGTTPNENPQGFSNPYMGPQPTYAPTYDPYDHTAEFEQKDISENKVVSMLVYLMGWIGIVIALLGSNTSPYVAFHVRQGLKFKVVDILMLICMILLCWTIIIPIAYLIMKVVFFVIRIICFFQICAGKAKEPAIIRSLEFLR